MATKLTDPDEIFRDSLVTNIQEIADILHDLNLAGDRKLDALIPKLHSLAAIEPEKLRKDNTLREETADDATQLAAKVAEYAASFSQFQKV
jgi:hypothetical protein